MRFVQWHGSTAAASTVPNELENPQACADVLLDEMVHSINDECYNEALIMLDDEVLSTLSSVKPTVAGTVLVRNKPVSRQLKKKKKSGSGDVASSACSNSGRKNATSESEPRASSPSNSSSSASTKSTLEHENTGDACEEELNDDEDGDAVGYEEPASKPCAACGNQLLRTVAVRDPDGSGAMIPVLDLGARLKFKDAHITARPKLPTTRLLARYDASLGGLVCESYDERFGREFEYYNDAASKAVDFRGQPLRLLEGRSSDPNALPAFELAASKNEAHAGCLNAYTSRVGSRQVYMEWIPLNVHRNPRNDAFSASAGRKGRLYLVLITHTADRGYADTEEKYRMRHTGEQYLPGTWARRRTDTAKSKVNLRGSSPRPLAKAKKASLSCSTSTAASGVSLQKPPARAPRRRGAQQNEYSPISSYPSSVATGSSPLQSSAPIGPNMDALASFVQSSSFASSVAEFIDQSAGKASTRRNAKTAQTRAASLAHSHKSKSKAESASRVPVICQQSQLPTVAEASASGETIRRPKRSKARSSWSPGETATSEMLPEQLPVATQIPHVGNGSSLSPEV